MAKEPDTNQEDTELYSIFLGGVTLAKRGKVITSGSPAVVYTDMEYKDVQIMWHTIIDNPEIAEALKNVADVAGPILVGLGDKFGIASGKMTVEDIAGLKP